MCWLGVLQFSELALSGVTWPAIGLEVSRSRAPVSSGIVERMKTTVERMTTAMEVKAYNCGGNCH